MYSDIPLFYHTAPTTTEAFFILCRKFCCSLSCILRYQPSCHNCFCLTIIFKSVATYSTGNRQKSSSDQFLW